MGYVGGGSSNVVVGWVDTDVDISVGPVACDFEWVGVFG